MSTKYGVCQCFEFLAGFGGGVGGRLRSSYAPGGGLLQPPGEHTVEADEELITMTLWFRVSTTSYEAFMATTPEGPVAPWVMIGLNVM